MHQKLLKQRNYKAVTQIDLRQVGDQLEVERPKDFSDLVANNIQHNFDSEENQDHSGLFQLHGMNKIGRFENIQEANEESGSFPEESKRNQDMLRIKPSLMERFKDPKSSASSDDHKRGLRLQTSSYDSKSNNSFSLNACGEDYMIQNYSQKEASKTAYSKALINDPKIIRNPTDVIIQQVNETKFMNNTYITSHLNHDSEMVDHHFEDSHRIVKREAEIRVIRSELSGETSNRFNTPVSTNIIGKSMIGKSTRSRNIQNTINESLDLGDSQGCLVNNKNFEDIETNEHTAEQTLNRDKKHNKKIANKTTLLCPNTNDEYTDFDTFREISSEVNQAKVKNLHAQDESTKYEQEEEKERIFRAPKLMGFFEEANTTQGMSRNIGLKNAQSNSVQLGKSLLLINIYRNR
jgi:hypothetical protein